MTDQWAIILAWFANYSNFYSVISVLVCFCAMVVFILRLNGEHLMGSTATHYNVVKEQKMVSLHSPFSMKLQETKSSSLKAGLHLNVSVTNAAFVSIFWGVNIQAFQKELNNKTIDIATNYKEKKLFDNKYLHMTDLESMQTEEGFSEISANCPPLMTEEELGRPPRKMYPVVVVSILQDWDILQEDNTTIVLQLTVFHMKDSICTLDSHIVYQFVKTRSNHMFSLQPIFMVTSDADVSPKSQQANDTITSESTPSPANTTNHTSCKTCSQADSSQQSQTESVDTPDGLNPNSQCDGFIDSQHDCHTGTITDAKPFSANTKANTSDSTDTTSMNEVSDDGQFCIVCQSEAIIYILLPCRHACVCGSCIRQLDRCPMCRGYIDAYFRLYSTNVSHEFNPSGSETTDERATLSRWQALNQRVNEFLGFS